MARCQWLLTASILMLTCAAPGLGASPTAQQALKLKPVQADVEYDTPTGKDLGTCTIAAGKVGGATGWIVRDGTGHLLRMFVDSNSDNVVDRWCYFRNGVEVYRDIDSNFNGKADQYRWLHTGGMRWGLDRDENGKIDEWKAISAEEVTAEVTRALAGADAARFTRLLLTPGELQGLGLDATKTKELAARIASAPNKFRQTQQRWNGRTDNTKWLHFGALQPGLVPASEEKSGRDIIVYENVVALVEAAGKPMQLSIGTLIQVGPTWRLIDGPRKLAENDEAVADTGGFFFKPAAPKHPRPQHPQTSDVDEKMQKLLSELETLDKNIAQAGTDARKAQLNAQRANVLEKLAAAAAKPEDRTQWIRQLADTVSAAIQAGHYPDGIARLKALYEKESARADNQELAAYVRFRQITSEYGLAVQTPKADFAKLQEQWLKNLEDYVSAYPNSPDTSEALLQLAIAQEFSGEEDKAKQWYQRIVRDFGSSPAAKKARGALTRLNSVGQPIRLSGTTVDGRRLDLGQYRGKVVLVHYWATWCDPCVNDLRKIKELYAQLGRSGFVPIGVNLDAQKNDLTSFLSSNRLPWPQLHEPGGLDGPLANELGVLTLPTMLLLDKRGRVVNRNLHIAELEAELKKYLKQ